MGSSNFLLASGLSDLIGKFSASALDKIFIVCDEVYWKAHSTKEINEVKNIVTAPTVTAEEKYHPKCRLSNHIRIVSITNQDLPCPTENTTGRRYFPLACSLEAIVEKKEDIFNVGVQKEYTEKLNDEMKKDWKKIAQILYCWPTTALDKFKAGHGVRNDHFPLLKAATQRYVSRYSPPCKWWFTIMDKKSDLYHSLVNNKYCEPVLPEELQYQEDNTPLPKYTGFFNGTFADIADKLCQLKNWNTEKYHPSMFIELADHIMNDLTPTNRVSMQRLYNLLEKAGLKDMFHHFQEDVVSEFETLHIMMNNSGDEDDVRALLKTYMDNKRNLMKISKKQFYDVFNAWYEPSKYPGDTMTPHINPDLLVQYIIPYVPWLTHLKDKDWLLIGSVDICRQNLEQMFKTADNLKVSTLSCHEVLRDIFMKHVDDKGCDDEFEAKFGTDRTFMKVDNQWWVVVFLKIMSDNNNVPNFMVPVRCKLDDDAKTDLLTKDRLEDALLYVCREDIVKIDCQIKYIEEEFLDPTNNQKKKKKIAVLDDPLTDKCYRESLQFLNHCPNTNAKSKLALNVARHMTAWTVEDMGKGVKLESSSTFLLPVKLDGIWSHIPFEHRKSTAYRIVIENNGVLPMRTDGDGEGVGVGQEPQEEVQGVQRPELQDQGSLPVAGRGTSDEEVQTCTLSDADTDANGECSDDDGWCDIDVCKTDGEPSDVDTGMEDDEQQQRTAGLQAGPPDDGHGECDHEGPLKD